MNILESLENLNISEETFNSILNIAENILEDYKSFEKEKMDKGDSQSYKELATVRNAIRRNKDKVYKEACKQQRKDSEDVAKNIFSKKPMSIALNKDLDKFVDKSKKSWDAREKAFKEMLKAGEEVNKARMLADEAEDREYRNK